MAGNSQTLLLLMTAALLSPAQATGQDCAEAVRNYEHSAQLSGDAPVLRERSADETLSDRLAQSGGVVRPPDAGSGVVIAPPRTGDGMETSPSAQPKTPEGEPQAQAGKRAEAQTALQSAREAARRGDDATCQTHLQEAQRLMEGGR